jgi:DNA-binding HxlR family transcriptional regulator
VTLERRLNHARAVLSKLAQQPLRWTPLLKATIPVCGSPPRLYYILKYLEKEGFVEHVTIKEKPHWVITERGKQFLKVLSRNTDEHPKKGGAEQKPQFRA